MLPFDLVMIWKMYMNEVLWFQLSVNRPKHVIFTPRRIHKNLQHFWRFLHQYKEIVNICMLSFRVWSTLHWPKHEKCNTQLHSLYDLPKNITYYSNHYDKTNKFVWLKLTAIYDNDYKTYINTWIGIQT